MIKLELKDYCQECEDFEAVVEKKYVFRKGYVGCTITCSEIENCEYGRKLCEKMDRQHKKLDNYVNQVIEKLK